MDSGMKLAPDTTYVVKCRGLYVVYCTINNLGVYSLTGLSYMATSKPNAPSDELLLLIADDIGVDILELEIIIRESEEKKFITVSDTTSSVD